MNRHKEQTENPPKVEITKYFNVSAEKVFDAWLDPDMLSRWMFGPDVRDEQIVKLETDPQEDGTFSYVVQRDGEELNHQGTYRKIDCPRKLVFTWGVDAEEGNDSIVTITIEQTNDGCRLVLIHEMAPKWADYTERTKKGWTSMLNQLQTILR